MSKDNAKNAIYIHSSVNVTPRCEVSICYSSSFHVPVSTRTQITVLTEVHPSLNVTSFLNICDHIDNIANANHQVFADSGLSPINSEHYSVNPEYIEQINSNLAKFSDLLDEYQKLGYINIGLNEESKSFIKSSLASYSQKRKVASYKKIFEIVTFIYMIYEIINYTFSPTAVAFQQNCIQWVSDSINYLADEISNLQIKK